MIKKELLEKGYLTKKTALHIICALIFIAVIYSSIRSFYTMLYDQTPTIKKAFFDFISPIVLVTLISYHLFYGSIYYLNLPFFMQYKINTVPWPWQQDPQNWPKILRHAIQVYLFNYLILGIGFIIVFFLAFKPRLSLDSIPSFAECLIQMTFCIFFEDFFFYFSHRFLHTSFMYKRIHKMHHEFNNPIHLFHIYTHWIEFIIGNMIPLFAGSMALGRYAHVVTIITFICYRIGESMEVHSGFEFPWSPYKVFPVSTDSAYHNYHHIKNMGNYATFFYIWDSLFETNKNYYAEVG